MAEAISGFSGSVPAFRCAHAGYGAAKSDSKCNQIELGVIASEAKQSSLLGAAEWIALSQVLLAMTPQADHFIR
jgi:hypothetical protein